MWWECCWMNCTKRGILFVYNLWGITIISWGWSMSLRIVRQGAKHAYSVMSGRTSHAIFIRGCNDSQRSAALRWGGWWVELGISFVKAKVSNIVTLYVHSPSEQTHQWRITNIIPLMLQLQHASSWASKVYIHVNFKDLVRFGFILFNDQLDHGCAKVAHCVTTRWRNFSNYYRPVRQYDVFWAQGSTDRGADSRRCTQTSDYSARVKYIVRHWASREASLRHSSGWGTEVFPLSSVICAPVPYTLHSVQRISYRIKV